MPFPLLGAVVLSSVAVSLAQPNDFLLSGHPWLALVAWVPFFWALRKAESARTAALLGALFGLLSTLMQDYWLAFFQNYAFWTITAPALGFAGYGAILGPFVWAFLRQNKDWRPFAVGALWVVYEYVKSNGFLGFPWGLAPYPFFQWPVLIQIVDITGLSFLTFGIISLNAWLAELVAKPGRATVGGGAFLAILLALTAGYGFWALAHPLPTTRTVQLLLIQQNNDPWRSGDDLIPLRTSVRESLEGLKTPGVDLVVWSETSIRRPLQDWRPYYEFNPVGTPLLKTIRASKTWWLFGNPYYQDFQPEKDLRSGQSNSTVLVNPQAQISNYYGKIQMVPMVETIPYWELPEAQAFYRSFIPVLNYWYPGRKLTIFEIPVNKGTDRLRFATPICFEDAFSWLGRAMVADGAELLINLSNDSWARLDSSQMQHQVAALFRAVENRVPLVRSTNSGVTSVIGPDGQLLAGPLPYFQEGHLNASVPLPAERPLTFYNRYGDWLVAFFAAVLGAVLWWRRRS